LDYVSEDGVGGGSPKVRRKSSRSADCGKYILSREPSASELRIIMRRGSVVTHLSRKRRTNSTRSKRLERLFAGLFVSDVAATLADVGYRNGY